MKTVIELVDFIEDSKEIQKIYIPRIDLEQNNKVVSYKYGDVFLYDGEVFCVYVKGEVRSLKGFYFVKYKSLRKKVEDNECNDISLFNTRDLIFIGNYFKKTSFINSYINNKYGHSDLLKYLYENYKEEIQFIKYNREGQSNILYINEYMLNDFDGLPFETGEIPWEKEIVVYFLAPFIKNNNLKIELPFESIGIISTNHFIMPVMRDNKYYIYESIRDNVKLYTLSEWMQKEHEESYKQIKTLYKKNDCLDYIYYLSSVNQ